MWLIFVPVSLRQIHVFSALHRYASPFNGQVSCWAGVTCLESGAMSPDMAVLESFGGLGERIDF